MLLTLLVFLFSANQALAICQGPLVPCGGADNPCQFCDLFVLLNNIFEFLMTCLTPIVAALMLVIAGLMFMISHFSEAELLPGGTKGGPQLFSKAKKAITAVVIGLAIIFIAYVFLNTFLDFIGVAEWTGLKTGWWDIKCQ